MQRQVGEHDAVAVRERVHDRLELAVREALGVQQCQRWPGPRLAIGDPRSVGMVVQAQLHVTSPLWESDSQSAGSRTRGFWQDAPSFWMTCASRAWPTSRSCARRTRMPGCEACAARC